MVANHLALGAKLTDFSGYQLPLHYGSILKEHEAVRKDCGLFDVSHMGRIAITGKETLPFLNYLSTNTIDSKGYGKAIYTVFCNERGLSVDDLMVFIEDDHSAFLVANGSNKTAVYEHMLQQAQNFEVVIKPCFEGQAILALQGPNSSLKIREWAPDLKKFTFARATWKGNPLILSKTGYTGEEGYEFYGDLSTLRELFDDLIEKKVQPCGLGARDLLRLEMGYALYGHELSPSINPIESVSAWCVKLANRTFLGKEAILALKESGKARTSIGAIGMSNAIAREGASVFKEDRLIGHVTSGSFSPTRGAPICCLLVNEKLAPSEKLAIKIREEFHPFLVEALPFIHKERT